MVHQRLGRTDLLVSPIGFGAFKIGRNRKVKYPLAYNLPDEDQLRRLLEGVLDLGINYIDTAPAYGASEQRLGRAISHRRSEVVLSTKVGETFENDQSKYDFSAPAIRRSLHESLRRLKTEAVDLVFVHSNGDDLRILHETDVVGTLHELRDQGWTRAIGFSGKTVEGATAALEWADAIMVQYHMDDQSHEAVMTEAASRGVGVVVKKGLASGHLPPKQAIAFVLGRPEVASLLIGGLNLEHIRANVALAEDVQASS